MSPTARSLQHLRTLGYQPAVVEQTVPHTFIKRDCFGVDILALKASAPILAVQCTTGSNHAARRTKLEAEGFITLWKGAGAVLEIWRLEESRATRAAEDVAGEKRGTVINLRKKAKENLPDF